MLQEDLTSPLGRSGGRKTSTLNPQLDKVYEPYIRARLGTAAHLCEVVVPRVATGRALNTSPPRNRCTFSCTASGDGACVLPEDPPLEESRLEHVRVRERRNCLVRIHFVIVMVRWTGLAPWESELPFPGSLISTPLEEARLNQVSVRERRHSLHPH